MEIVPRLGSSGLGKGKPWGGACKFPRVEVRAQGQLLKFMVGLHSACALRFSPLNWLVPREADEFKETPGDSGGQETWCAAVHGFTKSQTRLSNWTTARSEDSRSFRRQEWGQLWGQTRTHHCIWTGTQMSITTSEQSSLGRAYSERGGTR